MSATGKSCRCAPDPREAGFTLFEMLVAIAVLALIMGLGGPAIDRVRARQAMVEARGTVVLAMARARAEAVAQSAPVRLGLSATGGHLVTTGGTSGRMPADVVLPDAVSVSYPRAGFTFYADGTATAGNGAITAGTTTLRFAVDPVLGRVVFTP